MWRIATNVTCSVVCVSTVSVCVSVMRMYYAKTAESVEMPFGGRTVAGPRNHVLAWMSRLDEAIHSHEG